jgi:hypothetical protein
MVSTCCCWNRHRSWCCSHGRGGRGKLGRTCRGFDSLQWRRWYQLEISHLGPWVGTYKISMSSYRNRRRYSRCRGRGRTLNRTRCGFDWMGCCSWYQLESIQDASRQLGSNPMTHRPYACRTDVCVLHRLVPKDTARILHHKNSAGIGVFLMCACWVCERPLAPGSDFVPMQLLKVLPALLQVDMSAVGNPTTIYRRTYQEVL